MQGALLNAFHAQQDRLELLTPRQLDELKSEAEAVFQNASGTQQIAGQMIASLCTGIAKQRSGQ